jgi:hypothetical protein
LKNHIQNLRSTLEELDELEDSEDLKLSMINQVIFGFIDERRDYESDESLYVCKESSVSKDEKIAPLWLRNLVYYAGFVK